MRTIQSCLLAVMLAFVCGAPLHAKEGVEAAIRTPIRADSKPGTQVPIRFRLADQKDRHPFVALDVFVRFVGPSGEVSEAFATPSVDVDGEYNALLSVPKGGISSVEIGLAGTISDANGQRRRSDALFSLANDPLK